MSTSEGIREASAAPGLHLTGWVLAVAAAVAVGIAALMVALSTQSSTTSRVTNSVQPAVSFAPAPVSGPSVVRDPLTHALLQVRSPIQTAANDPATPVRDPITHARLTR